MRKRKQLQWMSDDMLNIEMAIRELGTEINRIYRLMKKQEDKKSEE